MTTYKFADHLLLRIPAKGYHIGQDVDVRKLLDEPFFLSAIYLASPGFYRRLELAGFNPERLNTRELNTLKKYHNRMCFRPTPFGLFATVSLSTWSERPGTVFIPTFYHTHICADQALEVVVGEDLLHKELRLCGFYQPNPSLYRTGTEYRFIRTELNEADRLRNYILQSTAYTSLLKKLVVFAEQGRSKSAIINFIAKKSGNAEAESEAYFEFLCDVQFLTHQWLPHITGGAYLEHLLQLANAEGKFNARCIRLQQVLRQLKLTTQVSPGVLIDLNERLQAVLPEGKQPEEFMNVVLKNSAAPQGLNIACQQHLTDGLFALDMLLPEVRLPALDQFIQAFKKQFDQESIPLLKALDPEVGIGYQQVYPAEQSVLLETLHLDGGHTEPSPGWTPTHRYLLECWHSALPDADGRKVICLKQDDLLQLKESGHSLQTLGLSVLFRIVNDTVWIESAGGVNAPALMGRFTCGDAEVTAAARAMALQMEAANPQIIFAELLHLSDPHSDNINRRESIWSYELPITATSLRDKENQVRLSDLYLSVENDRVILRSARHGKMVIPRLTSAYNYTRNKLPLFRFLADVPYQFSKFNLRLELEEFFPGLTFYPRVTYKRAILHLATWILQEKDIRQLQRSEAHLTLAAFSALAAQKDFPPLFSWVQGDQQLVFSSSKQEDILLFADCIKAHQKAVIKECLLDEDPGKALIRDGHGNAYVGQFNAFVYPDQECGIFEAPAVTTRPTGTRRLFIPGSEWLYLKIYAPKIAFNGLLRKLIPLLRRRYTHGPVGKWFFIRYDDPAPHIRLRIQMAPEDLGEMLLAMKERLEHSMDQHLVREYQVDTYKRELERYEGVDFNLTEDLFWRSSELVMAFYKPGVYPQRSQAYLFALVAMRDMLAVWLPGLQEQITFTRLAYEQFMPEFTAVNIQPELNKKYRELQREIAIQLSNPAYYAVSGLKAKAALFFSSVKRIKKALLAAGKADNYFLGSIIHMHLNRLFTDQPRKQEMIVYYLLHKFLLSHQARAHKGSAVL